MKPDTYKYLYTLSYESKPFYVGRTNDPKRRESEHRRNWKDDDHHEDVYTFIRFLESTNRQWTFNVIVQSCRSKLNREWEHAFVVKYTREGYKLMNMKHGDHDSIDTDAVAKRSASSSLKTIKREIRSQKEYERSERLRQSILGNLCYANDEEARAAYAASIEDPVRNLECFIKQNVLDTEDFLARMKTLEKDPDAKRKRKETRDAYDKRMRERNEARVRSLAASNKHVRSKK